MKRSGLSAGLLSGIKSSSNDIIVTLDGDGLNDPKDIKKMEEIKKNKLLHKKIV